MAAIGAGMNQAAMLADFVRHTDVDVLMLAGRYTLLEQDSLDDLLPLAMSVVSQSSPRAFSTADCLLIHGRRQARGMTTRDAPPEVVERARAIAAICDRHGTTLPAAAIAFPLAHPAVVSVCLGARSPHQVERNARLHREGVPPELWVELKASGLLREDAPVPRPEDPSAAA